MGLTESDLFHTPWSVLNPLLHSLPQVFQRRPTSYRFRLDPMNRDQEWHPFNPDDHSTHPSDISSVQVTFDNGRQANGDWLYGRFFNVYVFPESTITRWRYI
jgi:hypothetical protein